MDFDDLVREQSGKSILNFESILNVIFCSLSVKSAESRLNFFLFSFLFLFSFQFILYFSIFRTLGLGLEVICHTVTSDGMVTTLIIGLEKGVEGSEIK